MLECALIFREVFNSLGLEDSNYKNIPSEEEWEIASKICEFLKCFYEATLKFSGNKYPSIHLFLPEVIKIHSLLVEKLDSKDIFCRNMARKMKENFGKYWEQYNKVFEMAILLDPTRKLPYSLISHVSCYI